MLSEEGNHKKILRYRKRNTLAHPVLIIDNDMMSELPLGKYLHYKGKEYEVIGTARHSETMESYVVYRALYGDRGLWIRPKSMFLESIQIDGVETPRFRFLGEKSAQIVHSPLLQ